MLDENGDESRLRPSIQSYKSFSFDIIISFYDPTGRLGWWMRLNGLGVADGEAPKKRAQRLAGGLALENLLDRQPT